MNNHWKYVRYFNPHEFDDPDYPGSGDNIDGKLLLVLDKMRHETGFKIYPHWKAGGCVDMYGTHGHTPNSYHRIDRGCQAVDFHFECNLTLNEQYNIVCQYGFGGIGVYYDWAYKGFHVDTRSKKWTQHWVRQNGIYRNLLI